MTSTMSAARAARLISRAITSGSSGCTSLTRGRAPVSPAREASRTELLSVTSPGPSADPTGRISSPVGMIAATGRRATVSVACPAAAAVARSAGRRRWPAGMSSSPAGKSSPAARTFRPGGAGPVIWTLPSAWSRTRSRSTTVSMPTGTGLPVSTQVNEAAASCHTPAAPAGPAVIAMPSIAAQAKRGAAQRARTGAAATRSCPSRVGTSSTAGTPRQPAATHASIHCE